MRNPFRRHRPPMTREESLRQIRLGMAALGFPLDNFTDDELEQATLDFAVVLYQVGLTAQEANAALAKAWIAINRANVESPEEGQA